MNRVVDPVASYWTAFAFGVLALLAIAYGAIKPSHMVQNGLADLDGGQYWLAVGIFVLTAVLLGLVAWRGWTTRWPRAVQGLLGLFSLGVGCGLMVWGAHRTGRAFYYLPTAPAVLLTVYWLDLSDWRDLPVSRFWVFFGFALLGLVAYFGIRALIP